jgi:hypothetical protein
MTAVHTHYHCSTYYITRSINNNKRTSTSNILNSSNTVSIAKFGSNLLSRLYRLNSQQHCSNALRKSGSDTQHKDMINIELYCIRVTNILSVCIQATTSITSRSRRHDKYTYSTEFYQVIHTFAVQHMNRVWMYQY